MVRHMSFWVLCERRRRAPPSQTLVCTAASSSSEEVMQIAGDTAVNIMASPRSSQACFVRMREGGRKHNVSMLLSAVFFRSL